MIDNGMSYDFAFMHPGFGTDVQNQPIGFGFGITDFNPRTYQPTPKFTPDPNVVNVKTWKDYANPLDYNTNPIFVKQAMDSWQTSADLANALASMQSQLIRNPALSSSLSGPSLNARAADAPTTSAPAFDAPTSSSGPSNGHTISTNDSYDTMATKAQDAINRTSSPSYTGNYNWIDDWSNKPAQPTPTANLPEAPKVDVPNFEVDSDPLKLQTLNMEKPIEPVAIEQKSADDTIPLHIEALPMVGDTSSVAEDLELKAKTAPQFARLDADVPVVGNNTPAPLKDNQVYEDFKDAFKEEGGFFDKEGNKITNESDIAKRDDMNLRQIISDFADLTGDVTFGTLNKDQIKQVAIDLNNIPENRNTLEKVLDWGTKFITFGARPDMPGRDIPAIKDAQAFAEACGEGQDPKKLAELAFASAGGSPKAGLDYLKITGDTNNNEFAELAVKEINDAYANVLSGQMTPEQFDEFTNQVLDSPWRNFNTVALNNLKENVLRSGAMAAGAAAGQVAGKVATKVASKYPKVVAKILKNNSSEMIKHMEVGNPEQLASTLEKSLGLTKEEAAKLTQKLATDPKVQQRFFESIAEHMYGKAPSMSKAMSETVERLIGESGTKVGGALLESATEKAKEVIGKGATKAASTITAAAPVVGAAIANTDEAEAQIPGLPTDVPFTDQMKITQAVEDNREDLTNENLKPVHQVLMGENNFEDVYRRAVGDFDIGGSNTEAGQKFESATKSFTDKASEIWNGEGNILTKIGAIVKETYKYGTSMKDITKETAGGKIAFAWQEITMDVLRIIFQGMAAANGMNDAVITQLLSNATRTDLLDQILEWGGDLDDETRKGLEGLANNPGDVLIDKKPDITEVEEDEIQRYDTTAKDDSTLYNNGLRKEAYSDEDVKAFISRIIPHEPILLKVSRYL